MPPLESDTEELLRRVQQGDGSATHALFQRHRRQLSIMVAARLDPRIRGRVDPSDVIQETLAAASEKMAEYFDQRPLPFYPWLRQIAWEKLVHLHDRHLRTAKRCVTREQPLRTDISDESAMNIAECFIGPCSTPSGAALRAELQQRVREALARLAEADRELLLMRYVEQLTSKEIAAITDSTEAATNMRHLRALQHVRRLLSSDPREA